MTFQTDTTLGADLRHVTDADLADMLDRIAGQEGAITHMYLNEASRRLRSLWGDGYETGRRSAQR